MNCSFQEYSDVNATKAYIAGWNLAWIKILLWMRLRSYIYTGAFGAIIRPRENSLTWIPCRFWLSLSLKICFHSLEDEGFLMKRLSFHLIKRKHLLIRKEGPTQIIFLSCYDRTQISLRLLWRAVESIKAMAPQYLAFFYNRNKEDELIVIFSS